MQKCLSILLCKCPKCWKGHLFYPIKNENIISKWFKMRDYCEICQLKYEIEVGFFYGAMYVAYGITVTWGVFIFLMLWTFTNNHKNPFFYTGTTALFIVLFSPLTYRLSRSLWLHFFIQKKQ